MKMEQQGKETANESVEPKKKSFEDATDVAEVKEAAS